MRKTYTKENDGRTEGIQSRVRVVYPCQPPGHEDVDGDSPRCHLGQDANPVIARQLLLLDDSRVAPQPNGDGAQDREDNGHGEKSRGHQGRLRRSSSSSSRSRRLHLVQSCDDSRRSQVGRVIGGRIINCSAYGMHGLPRGKCRQALQICTFHITNTENHGVLNMRSLLVVSKSRGHQGQPSGCEDGHLGDTRVRIRTDSEPFPQGSTVACL